MHQAGHSPRYRRSLSPNNDVTACIADFLGSSTPSDPMPVITTASTLAPYAVATDRNSTSTAGRSSPAATDSNSTGRSCRRELPSCDNFPAQTKHVLEKAPCPHFPLPPESQIGGACSISERRESLSAACRSGIESDSDRTPTNLASRCCR